MVATTPAKSPQGRAKGHTPVARETLQMLNVVLKTAFRMHCTGETVCGKGPWQLVQDVQLKLLELSEQAAGLISEERLAHYLETALTGSAGNGVPPLKLVGAN